MKRVIAAESKRTTRLFAISLLLLGSMLILAIAILFATRDRLLTENATRIPENNRLLLAWASNRQAITCRWQRPKFQYTLLDIQTGFSAPLKSVNDSATNLRSSVIGRDIMSPDGKWLLWRTDDYRTSDWSKNYTVAASMTGTEVISRPVGRQEIAMGWQEYPVSPVWMQDSEHWITMSSHYDHDGDVSDKRTVYLNVASTKSSTVRTLPITHARGVQRLLGVTPNGQILACGYQDGKENALFTRYTLHTTSVSMEQYPIAIPVKYFYQVAGVVMSPDGKRLAWTLDAEPRPKPWLDTLSRWCRMPVIYNKRRMEIWLSRPDGSDMRLLGYLPNDDYSADFFGRSLKWLPDSKKLSFSYKDAYWVVDPK